MGMVAPVRDRHLRNQSMPRIKRLELLLHPFENVFRIREREQCRELASTTALRQFQFIRKRDQIRLIRQQ
jgi:hypothetical protein